MEIVESRSWVFASTANDRVAFARSVFQSSQPSGQPTRRKSARRKIQLPNANWQCRRASFQLAAARARTACPGVTGARRDRRVAAAAWLRRVGGMVASTFRRTAFWRQSIANHLRGLRSKGGLVAAKAVAAWNTRPLRQALAIEATSPTTSRHSSIRDIRHAATQECRSPPSTAFSHDGPRPRDRPHPRAPGPFDGGMNHSKQTRPAPNTPTARKYRAISIATALRLCLFDQRNPNAHLPLPPKLVLSECKWRG